MITGNKQLKIGRDQKSGGVGTDEMCVPGQLWPLLVMEIMEINEIFWKEKVQNE